MCVLLSSLLFLLFLLVQKITSGTFSEITGLCRFWMKSGPTDSQVRRKASPLRGAGVSLLPRYWRGPRCSYLPSPAFPWLLSPRRAPTWATEAPLCTCSKRQKQSYVYLYIAQICFKEGSISNFTKLFPCSFDLVTSHGKWGLFNLS